MNSILSQKLVSLKIFIVIIYMSIYINISVLQAQKEASALLKWKSSLGSQSQLVLISWDRNVDLCKSWTGITCSNNTLSESIVTSISIRSSSLKGNLGSFDFASFQNLQRIDFYNNSLSGPIPSNLSNASQLKVLELSFNNFSGVIPYNLGMLRCLEFLSVLSNSLTGDIPKSIGNLTNVVYLFLLQNHLSGTIPKEIGLLSRKLENLDFSSNNLTGEIPSSLGNLTRMYFFYLYDNNLSGTIPSELVGAYDLMDLQVYDNNLSGKILDSFRNFTRLDRLDLYSNHLSGKFPKEINLSKIRSLLIDGNMLSGPLPRVGELIQSFTASDNLFSGPIWPEIGNASGLIELYLSRNQLSGPIPNSLGNASRLVKLYLSRNQLSGPIPNSIGNLTSLRYLNLDDNMFHGTLPKIPINIIVYSIKNNTMEGEIHSSICSSISLEFFLVSNNIISGVVPDCFKSGSNLTSLDLYENQLQGLVPRSLKNCNFLEVLDLGKNMISDVFPQWLDTLPRLQVLVLKSGSLHGPVNTSRSQLPFPGLRILDISGNLFTGHLPSNYFENFKAIMDIDGQERGPRYMGRDGIYADSVELVVKGRELKFERILTVLTSIDLSNNEFEGEIPDNIRMLNSLHYLNLSHNHLTGHIPETLRNLTQLEALDLSSNHVTGNIPPELTRLTFMAVFNVSNNQLSGTIPPGGQFNTYERNSYQGNPALCGSPLPKPCREKEVATSLPLSPLQEDDSTFFNGFTWESVVLGYACGIVLGIGFGCVMLIKGKPNWVLRLVNERKLRDD